MKILPISDIHGNGAILKHILKNYNTNDYDLLTISGDISEGSSIVFAEVIKKFQREIKKPIVMIQGNHDYWDNTIFNRTKDIYLLHNQSITIDGVVFYGSPYSPKFMNWNWMDIEDNLYTIWNSTMPEKIDVCLIHGPPYGFCDNCNQSSYGNNEHSKLGSKALHAILFEKNIRYLMCGHIHTGDRHKTHPSGTEVYNVSVLDETYSYGKFNPYPAIVEI